MNEAQRQFLDWFPNHVYRYIDQTDLGRKVECKNEFDTSLNIQGYGSFFTVNGFIDKDRQTIDHCTNLNSFFIDIDGGKEEATKKLNTIIKSIHPTFVVETHNGFHVYFALDEPIYRDDYDETNWGQILFEWVSIQKRLASKFGGDDNARDAARVLRVPGTYYWKHTGDAYKKGVEHALCVIKYRDDLERKGSRYSIDKMISELEGLGVPEIPKYTPQSWKNMSLANETIEYIKQINILCPIAERESYKKIISGEPDPFVSDHRRNSTLLVAASWMMQAGVSLDDAIAHIIKTGWHGMAETRNGIQEIKRTVKSAYKNAYIFYPGKKREEMGDIVSHFVDQVEEKQIQDAKKKLKKEQDERERVLFHNYEYILAQRHPHIRRTTTGSFYEYKNGVYKPITDENYVYNLVYDSMQGDGLEKFKTTANANNKISTWKRLIPIIDLTSCDKDHDILNVKNGLLNIKTRELFPHTPEYLSIYQSPVPYIKDATCPVWERCVEAWMKGEEAEGKANLLQEFMGYCLPGGKPRFAKMLVMLGTGGNGKSTFAETLSALIGYEGSSFLSVDDLMQPFGLIELLGKRINITEEVSDHFYRSDIIKKIVSSETLTANRKNKDYVTFEPTTRFIMAVNEFPRVDDNTNAMDQRTLAIAFKNVFRGKAHENTALRFDSGILRAELSGILNWALDGLDRIESRNENGSYKGFSVTKESQLITRQAKENNSSVGSFIRDCLVESPGKIIDAAVLFQIYKDYAKHTGLGSTGRNKFYGHLEMIGSDKLQIITNRKGKRLIEGVALSEEGDSFAGFVMEKVYVDEEINF